MKLTLNFTELGKNDALIAGGKGASLGEMTQNGIPVPPGFVVLSTTFDEFIKEADLIQEIDSIIDGVNHKDINSVEVASEKIQALIKNAQMPESIASEIKTKFKDLDTEFVAVRSSATAEDGADNAWAGQLDSFLNTKESNLLEKVQHCWASLFTPRAIFYRFEKGLHTTKISVAVVVQKMVNSEVSGIAFSVHPVTEDRNQMIIEAGFGLGEAIVSGSVTPDSYVIEKDPRRIIDINVSSQTRALYRVETGGNEWIDIPEPKASSQVLTEAQISEFADLIMRIENHYGFPCDIEWAFEKGKFYIVQSRPITTLRKKEGATKIFEKFITRPYSLIQIQSYYNMLDMIKIDLGYITYPIFRFCPETKVCTAYYDMKELQIVFKKISELFTNNTKFRNNFFNEFEDVVDKILPFLENKKEIKNLKEFKEFYSLFTLFMKDVGGYGWVIPQINGIPEELNDRLVKKREILEKYSGMRDKIFLKIIPKIIVDDLIDPFFITYEEVIDYTSKKSEYIKEREGGFLIYKDKILTEKSINGFLEENMFILKEPEILSFDEIKGASASNGIIKGKCKLVYTEEDMVKINSGDILVSPMTRPEFLPAIKKSGAVITDEGGVTCHAAIVARELKIPCIIGTKIATKVLKDGDMVEVDANTGIVKIIK